VQMYKKKLLPKTSLKIFVFCLIYSELVFSFFVRIDNLSSIFAEN
jgi:hypothetical protein